MKKLMLTLIGIVAISLTGLNAKSLPAVAAKLPAEFKEAIVSEIDYPNFAQQNLIEGEVWMKVMLQNDSKLRIVDLSSTQPELGEYVKNELSDVTLINSNVKPGQEYFLKINFELVK